MSSKRKRTRKDVAVRADGGLDLSSEAESMAGVPLPRTVTTLTPPGASGPEGGCWEPPPGASGPEGDAASPPCASGPSLRAT